MTPSEQAAKLIQGTLDKTQDPRLALDCALHIVSQIRLYVPAESQSFWESVEIELRLVDPSAPQPSRNPSLYQTIATAESYTKLLQSELFFQFFPELSGDWNRDKFIIYNNQLK